MKKTINGKRFDTETATLIGFVNNLVGTFPAESKDGPTYWEAGLYVTPRSKEYFLAGKGGPMTRFAQHKDGSRYRGGAGVVPMTDKDAADFAKWYLNPSVVEQYFNI